MGKQLHFSHKYLSTFQLILAACVCMMLLSMLSTHLVSLDKPLQLVTCWKRCDITGKKDKKGRGTRCLQKQHFFRRALVTFSVDTDGLHDADDKCLILTSCVCMMLLLSLLSTHIYFLVSLDKPNLCNFCTRHLVTCYVSKRCDITGKKQFLCRHNSPQGFLLLPK